MEFYNKQTDEESYTYYFEKLAALNKQMKRTIERESRRLSSDDRLTEVKSNSVLGKPPLYKHNSAQVTKE